MIPYDIRVYQANTLADAREAWADAAAEGLKSYFMSGGTEVVTLARDGKQIPGALIDIKRIPEAQGIHTVADPVRGDTLRIGAAVPLSVLRDDERFGLFSRAAGGVADRTVRNMITLGGNIAGMLPYREAVLPFLLFDTTAEIAVPTAEAAHAAGGADAGRIGGIREAPLSEAFRNRLLLGEGEFLVALRIPASTLDSPWFYRRRTRDSRVDYPLVTLCAVRHEGSVRFSVSGAFNAPVREAAAEAAYATVAGQPGKPSGQPGSERGHSAAGAGHSAAARTIAAAFTAKLREDFRAGADYRRALLELSLEEMIDTMERRTGGADENL